MNGVPVPQVHRPTSTRRHGGSGDRRAGAPSPRSSVPSAPVLVLQPPTDLHYELKTPDLIRLTWRAVAKDVQYNIYSSGARELTNLRKENEQPVKMNVVTWTPETGLDRYWVVVTTVGPDGKESAYSEAIEVVRYPEKSGPGAADAAAGVLRKVLSW